ncbi:MAG: HIT domain-containing protein [Gammaproteobacteria bacterium]|nr:HIT domain-containing protein [Gammaproteobacteria bacterium]
MENFKLDEQLKKDCLVLGKLPFSYLLLLNNSLAPWFILVPETEQTELYKMHSEDQHKLLEEINLISSFVQEEFNISKINVATIGNIVRQMHVHIVGRHEQDYCWPGVVWGNEQKQAYQDCEINTIVKDMQEKLGKHIEVFTSKSRWQ